MINEEIPDINEATLRAETLRRLLTYPHLDDRYREAVTNDPWMPSAVSRIMDVLDIRRAAEAERAIREGRLEEQA